MQLDFTSFLKVAALRCFKCEPDAYEIVGVICKNAAFLWILEKFC